MQVLFHIINILSLLADYWRPRLMSWSANELDELFRAIERCRLTACMIGGILSSLGPRDSLWLCPSVVGHQKLSTSDMKLVTESYLDREFPKDANSRASSLRLHLFYSRTLWIENVIRERTTMKRLRINEHDTFHSHISGSDSGVGGTLSATISM